MATSPDKLKKELLQHLEDHLQGVERATLRGRLQRLCNKTEKDAITLYREAHITTDDLKMLGDRLYLPSRIIESNQAAYNAISGKAFNKNQNTFLNQIKKQLGLTNDGDRATLFYWIQSYAQEGYGHGHLLDFHHLIQDIKPTKDWSVPLFFTTFVSASTAIYFYFSPEQLLAFERLVAKTVVMLSELLEATFSILRNIPLVLLIYNAICIPHATYKTIYHDTFRAPQKRLQKWVTNTVPSIFSLVSYALCFAANGVFTPLAVSFFIASSFIAVFNSFFNLFQLTKLGEAPKHNAPFNEKADYLRQQERLDRTRSTIKVNLTASVLISAAVLIWGLFPPSLLIMVGSILFINLVGFTKNFVLQRIHSDGAEELQITLMETLKESTPPQETPNESANISRHQVQNKLSQIKKELRTLNTALLQHSMFNSEGEPANDASSQDPQTRPRARSV
ncbi:MAG: hypothetical protein QNK11_01895 [Legionella sp.]|nr:hypothetical protein [Legionella sp.]